MPRRTAPSHRRNRKPSNVSRWVLFCDGASRGNPGPGAYGFVLYEGREIIAKKGAILGVVTNNIAEYQGLVRGLEKCLELGVKNLTVKSDSELLVRQLNGLYKVKSPQLLPLFETAKLLLKRITHSEILHVRRSENSLADALCNEALDKGLRD